MGTALPNSSLSTKMMKTTIFFCVVFITTCTSLELPPTFKKCHRNQSDVNKCFASAFQDALSQLTKNFTEYGIPSLNPLFTSYVTIPAGKTVFKIPQKYTNFKIYGLPTTNVSKFEWNFDNNTIYIETTFPEVRLEFEYDLEGEVFSIPIKGKGPGSISAIDITFFIIFKLEEYEKDGQKYFKVIETVVTKEPRLIKFNFENLSRVDNVLGGLGGLSKQAGETLDINELLNENWRKIFDDVKVGYLDFQSGKYQEIFNNLLDKVPISKFFANE